jgi:hypothetical protein
MLSYNLDRWCFHFLDRIRRSAAVCRNFLNIMSRGEGIMLASIVSLFYFPINTRFLQAILLICQAHIPWGIGFVSSS